MIGTGHWDIHHCQERDERNNDPTITILKVVRDPLDGFPNRGQFQVNLSIGTSGFFIKYCPFCKEDLMLK